MTEMALLLPLFVVLLVGGAQIGALLYAQVTMDTAVREGVRVAAQQPNNSEAYSSGSPLAMTKLTTAINRGQTNVTTLNVSALVTAIAPGPILLVSTTLQGGQVVTTSSGASVGATTITVTSFTALTAYAAGAPVMAAHQCTTNEYTAAAVPANPACEAVYQSLGLLTGNSGVNTYTAPLCTLSGGVDLSGIGAPSCLNGSTTTGCNSSAVQDGAVVVAVTYTVPVFVPIIGAFLSTPGGNGGHTDLAVLSNRVSPCTMNQGN